MTESAGRVPTPQSLPGTWPTDYADPAKELGFRLLRAWRDSARAQGHDFLVLYVPRSEAMLRGDYPLTDTWRPWLGETCAALDIPLVDPADSLRYKMKSEVPVYDDHWTSAGHEVISRVLRNHLAGMPQPPSS